MKVTIKDIANIAGVSYSTVSRALNDSPQINTETKDKIKKIAKIMNFQFNSGARSLKGVKTGNIAVIYDTHHDLFGSALYLNQLFIEIRHALEDKDMDAILLEGYNPVTNQSNIDRLLRQQKVDGFLIVHDKILNRDYQHIEDSGLPIVQLHLKPKFYKIDLLDYFVTDSLVGGFMATEHLIKAGCKKILTVHPDEKDSLEFLDRTNGYKQALEKYNLEFSHESIIKTECSFIAGYNLFIKIKNDLRDVDGIFFQTDVQAFGFLTAAKESSINIPGDFKVIGFDDTPVCYYTSPQLSTIHQPKKDLAELAVNRIVDLINKKEIDKKQQQTILPKLILRESC
jgi:LacI family transcriptional regulator